MLIPIDFSLNVVDIDSQISPMDALSNFSCKFGRTKKKINHVSHVHHIFHILGPQCLLAFDHVPSRYIFFGKKIYPMCQQSCKDVESRLVVEMKHAFLCIP
jgi:hypothetical protein